MVCLAEGHVSYSVLLDKMNSGNTHAASHGGAQASFNTDWGWFSIRMPMNSLVSIIDTMLSSQQQDSDIAVVCLAMHGGQMKQKLMNRSVGLCGPDEKERQCRLVSNVFNFEVMGGQRSTTPTDANIDRTASSFSNLGGGPCSDKHCETLNLHSMLCLPSAGPVAVSLSERQA